MSDELRLPDDLAALEARLAGQSLPASGVNRDELMYRAGWAACEAQQARAVSLPTQPPRHGSARFVAWSLTSAALAASLAVAATLYLQSPRGVRLAEEIHDSAQASVAASTPAAPQTATPVQAAAVVDYLALVSNPDACDFVTPLLASHRRQLRFSLPQSVTESVANGAATSSPKTASQLREEFLPTPSPTSDGRRLPLVWPWTLPVTGESI
jgi:hypothetical protein